MTTSVIKIPLNLAIGSIIVDADHMKKYEITAASPLKFGFAVGTKLKSKKGSDEFILFDNSLELVTTLQGPYPITLKEGTVMNLKDMNAKITLNGDVNFLLTNETLVEIPKGTCLLINGIRVITDNDTKMYLSCPLSFYGMDLVSLFSNPNFQI